MEQSKTEKSKPQPSKRKMFEISRKNFAIAGITPDLVHQSYPLNWTILFGFLLVGSSMFYTSMFIICDAETFTDYTLAVHAYSLEILISFDILVILLKVEKLFEFINNCSTSANTSA